MTEDTIAEVGIDQEQRLFVRPTSEAFPQIYRAAMGIDWDQEEEYLFAPAPKDWTYVNWFNQIIWAAADEYGVWLRLTPDTVWSGVSDELCAEIQSGPIPPIATRLS